MKLAKTVLLLVATFFIHHSTWSQDNAQGCNPPPSCLAKPVNQEFSDCAAAFLGSKMIVDNYSPNGKCTVEPGAKGMLSVSTVNLDPFNLSSPFKPVGFKVAIRNEKTNTLWLFSDEVFYKVPIEKILAQCQFGDKIILLTVDKAYSLPHNEIAVMWGC